MSFKRALILLSSLRRQFVHAGPRGGGRAQDGEPPSPRARRGGPRGRRRPDRRRRALDGARGRVRRHRPRPHAPGARRGRGLPAPARARCLVAGPHADRARRRRGSRRRPRRGRRRLPAEAVLLRRAPRPPARARSPRVRSSGRPCSRSATSGSTRRRGRSGAATTEIHAVGEGVRAARDVHAPPRAGALALQLLEHAWDYGYENRSNVVDVYVRYLREKVDRPFGRTTLETVRGVGLPAPRRGRVVSRLPVRIRLTLAFALAMAVVLAAVGAFLYVRLGDSLEEQLDESLAARAETLAALVRRTGGGRAARRRWTTKPSPRSSIRTARRSSPRRRLSERATAPGLLPPRDVEGHRRAGARLLVTPVGGGAASSSSAPRSRTGEEALDGLLAQLFVVGPLALLLTAVAGYALAAAALRPVEAMRRRADEVSSERPGQRLPLPAAQDEIHRLGETLNAMLARLEAGLARERRFVADASHELRTPLALLQTELELALRRPRSTEELEARCARPPRRSTGSSGSPRTCSCSPAWTRAASAAPFLDLVDRGLLDAVAARFEPRRGPTAAPSRSTRPTATRSSATASGWSRRSATSSTTPCGTAPARSASRPSRATGRSSCM